MRDKELVGLMLVMVCVLGFTIGFVIGQQNAPTKIVYATKTMERSERLDQIRSLFGNSEFTHQVVLEQLRIWEREDLRVKNDTTQEVAHGSH